MWVRGVGKLGAPSEREAKISASEAWPSEAPAASLGPHQRCTCKPRASQAGRSASAAAVLCSKTVEKPFSPRHMSPGRILQPGVPGRARRRRGGAKTGQRAVSADHQRSRETPGPEPEVSVQARSTPASRRSSGQPAVGAGRAVRTWCPAACEGRAAQPRNLDFFCCDRPGCEVYFPRPILDLEAAAVLQLFLPPGFAVGVAGARTAVAPALRLLPAPAGRGSFPWTVSPSGISFLNARSGQLNFFYRPLKE